MEIALSAKDIIAIIKSGFDSKVEHLSIGNLVVKYKTEPQELQTNYQYPSVENPTLTGESPEKPIIEYPVNQTDKDTLILSDPVAYESSLED